MDRIEALEEYCDIDSVENRGLTPDQWRLADFDNAINAESALDAKDAMGWLEKALYCFQQVNDAELVSTARCHLSSVRFRLELEMIPLSDSRREKSDPELELRAAQVMDHLLSESLVEAEARVLGETVLPFVSDYSQEQLKSRLLAQLAEETGSFCLPCHCEITRRESYIIASVGARLRHLHFCYLIRNTLSLRVQHPVLTVVSHQYFRKTVSSLANNYSRRREKRYAVAACFGNKRFVHTARVMN